MANVRSEMRRNLNLWSGVPLFFPPWKKRNAWSQVRGTLVMTDNWFHKRSTLKSSDSHFKFFGVPHSTFDYDRGLLANTMFAKDRIFNFVVVRLRWTFKFHACLQIEYKLNSVQMKFLRLLSKSAFQEMTYSCTDLNKGCMVDLKGENEMVVNNSDKINLDVTEVGTADQRL